MSKITVYSNWCSIDQLDGQTLQDGERLVIKWPDGTSEYVEITVISTSEPYFDHGHAYTMPISKAYYRTDYRGIAVDVPLVGLEAERCDAIIADVSLNI